MIRMQKLCMKPSMDSTWPCAWLASAAGQVPNIISNYYYLSNNNSDDNDIQKVFLSFHRQLKTLPLGQAPYQASGWGEARYGSHREEA